MYRWLLLFLWLPLFAAETVPGRYLVELSTPSIAAHFGPRTRAALKSTLADNHRRLIRSEQQRAQQAIERRGGRVRHSLDTVANLLVVEASEEQIEEVRNLPGVVRVSPDRVIRVTLDHIVNVHKVVDAWSTVGIENAGKGMKIAIIDTGIDINHPGFQDPTLPVPDGYPLASKPEYLEFTNNKVIVARSYVSTADREPSPRDHVGHGTSTAMVAAGGRAAGPLATITGIAPKAYIGNYRVFGSPEEKGVTPLGSTTFVLRAMDDAVKDGMDVINLSLGNSLSPEVAFDPEAQAVERASAAGIIVVIAAGNDGPDANTISSPGTAPSALTVGASANERVFASAVQLDGGRQYYGIDSGTLKTGVISGTVADVSLLDPTALACNPLPEGSLSGVVALVARGECNFEVKLNNVAAAGGVAAIIYSDDRPVNSWTPGAATLPAILITHDDGLDLKSRLGDGVKSTLRIRSAITVSADSLANFTAKGPGLGMTIKPDLVAVGINVYTAAQMNDPLGSIYNVEGFVTEQGTSYSAPVVTGAAAIVKAARPGLTAAQYRSLLVNTASRASLKPGSPAGLQQAGAGVLDVSAALRATATANPVSLSFGSGTNSPQLFRTFALTNVGTATETFQLSVLPISGSAVPQLTADSVELAPGGTVEVNATLTGNSLSPGEYSGFIAIQGTVSGVETHLPYWYGVSDGVPTAISILREPDPVGPNGVARYYFRVLDSSGTALTLPTPTASVISGGGSAIIASMNSSWPGVFELSFRVGPFAGSNNVQIQAGEAKRTLAIFTVAP